MPLAFSCHGGSKPLLPRDFNTPSTTSASGGYNQMKRVLAGAMLSAKVPVNPSVMMLMFRPAMMQGQKSEQHTAARHRETRQREQ